MFEVLEADTHTRVHLRMRTLCSSVTSLLLWIHNGQQTIYEWWLAKQASGAS